MRQPFCGSSARFLTKQPPLRIEKDTVKKVPENRGQAQAFSGQSCATVSGREQRRNKKGWALEPIFLSCGVLARRGNDAGSGCPLLDSPGDKGQPLLGPQVKAIGCDRPNKARCGA